MEAGLLSLGSQNPGQLDRDVFPRARGRETLGAWRCNGSRRAPLRRSGVDLAGQNDHQGSRMIDRGSQFFEAKILHLIGQDAPRYSETDS